MMTTMNQSQRDLQATIIERASQDPAFRQALLNHPKAALSDFLGINLPQEVNINVLEEKHGQHYLVLPPAPQSLDALPLDDLELALVGGGRTLRPIPVQCFDTRRRSTSGNRRTAC